LVGPAVDAGDMVAAADVNSADSVTIRTAVGPVDPEGAEAAAAVDQALMAGSTAARGGATIQLKTGTCGHIAIGSAKRKDGKQNRKSRI
jgi:hypothetical protein